MSGTSKFQDLMRQQRASAPPDVGAEDDDVFNPDDYRKPVGRSFTLGQGRRQSGFSIAMVFGKIHYWISYHSIRRLRSFELNSKEYLEFTHENLAVTIEGKRLDQLLHLIGEGRLKAIFEPAKPEAVHDGNSAQILAMRVTDVEEAHKDSSSSS